MAGDIRRDIDAVVRRNVEIKASIVHEDELEHGNIDMPAVPLLIADGGGVKLGWGVGAFRRKPEAAVLDVQTALDLAMTARYEGGAEKLAIDNLAGACWCSG